MLTTMHKATTQAKQTLGLGVAYLCLGNERTSGQPFDWNIPPPGF